MKLEFLGHDERYIVEQSLMTLFPLEKPTYDAVQPEDEAWCRLATGETAADCQVTAELHYHGYTAAGTFASPLTGTDFEKEGQRRYAVAACFYLAFLDLYPKLPEALCAAEKLTLPPWGMLTGVRPDKPITRALMEGKTPEEAKRELKARYFVPEERAALALETGAVGYQALKRLEKRDIDLYVGIPFCPTRCAYCSFVSQSVERSFSLVEPYVKALIAEIRSGGDMVRSNRLRPRAFYMGGGTPTTLSAPQMERLLRVIRDNFDLSRCVEFTVEGGRPDTLDLEKLQIIRSGGADRMSINPQTMEDAVLRACGRPHKAADVLRAYGEAVDAGFSAINMDLIAGLPADTTAGFRRSLDAVATLNPANITVHTLALKKGADLFEKRENLPSAGDVAEMVAYGEQTLRALGYKPYYLYRQKYMSGSFENVGWSRDNLDCLYNIYMMEEVHTILSLGGGGMNKVNLPDGTLRRFHNPKFPEQYIEMLPGVLEQKQELFRLMADGAK